jgi:hypothetical protein
MLRRLAASLALLTALACGAPTPATPAPTPAKPAQPPAKPADPPLYAPEPAACADFPAAAQLAAVTAATDLPAVAAAYLTTPLQQTIQASDAASGRKDDAAVTAALADTTPAARVIATTAIQNALSQSMRASLKVAAEDPDKTKRPPAWQAARCAWQHGVRPLAAELQSRSAELSSETAREDAAIADDIDALFATDPTDERKLLPARQAIEKTWYRVLHRLIESEARKAHDAADPVAARRALGLFAMLRDRLQDRNTPGITIVESQLVIDLAKLDPAGVLRQIDLALIKRARKYCSEAVDPKLHGTAAGAASVQEGMTYTKIFLPAMRTALAAQKFDAAGHMATWQAYADAVDSGDDRDEIKRLSDELVHWNCAYQQVLGIRECTSTADELPPK